jgi:hypothetical protein
VGKENGKEQKAREGKESVCVSNIKTSEQDILSP